MPYKTDRAHRMASAARQAEYRKSEDWCRKQALRVMKHRAKDKGLEFSITVDDLQWPDTCPILGTPIGYTIGTKWDSPSVDRVDSSKGYTPDNVRVISTLANSMKAHATPEQLAAFSRNIMAYMG